MFSKVIEGTHLFVLKSELQCDLASLRRKYSVTPKFDNIKVVSTYRETREWFGFPRHDADVIRKSSKFLDDRRSEGGEISFSMTYEPRLRQVGVLSRCLAEYNRGTTGILLVAPTGTGKTYMLLNLISVIGKTALIVVPRDYIIKQWIERILEHTSLSRDDIGIARQDKCEFEGKKIVIGMVHSLARDKYSDEFKKWPGVLAIDEVHVTGAYSFSRVVGMFPAEYRIGASATPTRQDGMDEVYRMALAQSTVTMTGGTDVSPHVVLREYVASSIPRKLSAIHDRLSRRGVIISAIANDVRRNTLLAYFINRLYMTGRRVLVISDRKSQLTTLHGMLTGRFSIDKKTVDFFVQETPDKKRKDILRDCSVILATYGMMAMAVDVPDLSGLVFGTPQSQVTQPVGRVLRKCSGKKNPVVIDMVDLAYMEAVRWAEKRKRVYTEMDADISLIYHPTDQGG